MASETKIKVKTPLVELDGDEVWVSFYSSNFQSDGFTSLYFLVLGWRIIVSKTRGNTGNTMKIHVSTRK